MSPIVCTVELPDRLVHRTVDGTGVPVDRYDDGHLAPALGASREHVSSPGGRVNLRIEQVQRWRNTSVVPVSFRRWLALLPGHIVVGLCTAPLNTVLCYSVEPNVDPARRTEAVSSVSAANEIGVAVPGTFLALMPLPASFGVSGAFAASFLVCPLSKRRTRVTSVCQPVPDPVPARR